MIFYFAYDHDRHAGGQKWAYRHVDILNANGIDASILHLTDGFRLTWFPNETKVTSGSEFERRYKIERDILVLPEDLGSKIAGFPGKKVIFNQNLFHGFHVLGSAMNEPYAYRHPEVAATLAVSEHNADALRFAFPGLAVHRVRTTADSFSRRPLVLKKRQIAFSPKNKGEILTLMHMLRARGEQANHPLGAFSFVLIEGLPDVRPVLEDSLVFVFLSTDEGLPVMPLEAMRAGCLVVARQGGPTGEYLPPASGFAAGDVVGMARRIEEIAIAFPERIGEWEALASEGEMRASEFSRERETESVITAWRAILGERGR